MSIDLGMPQTPPAPLAERRLSRQIMVGSVPVGGGAPVTVQSMTTTLTATGAPPPTGTGPTMIWRDSRRSASGAGGVCGIPRSILMSPIHL